MPDFVEKCVVVTGGAKGIGAATVRRFVAAGAAVVFGDIDRPAGDDLARELGERTAFVATDVRKEDDVAALLEAALTRFGRLDCVVNNAGAGGVYGPIGDTPVEGFDDTITLLLRSVFLGTKHAVSRIDRDRGGSIVNIASIAALQAGYAGHAYSAAKAAVVQLTRTTAMELGERKIRVNCICPGGIATGIFGSAFNLPADTRDKTIEAVKPLLAAASPLRRAGMPDDIANAVLWLASDEAAFINGHALVVDGGTTGGRHWSQSQAEGQLIARTLFAAISSV
jgi:NAD(P)-dependent dehydrogenase (short-subunit alcohol dehydrogenase family)